MASTRVLPFVRGIDLSYNNFQDENFPREIMKMTGLRWLKLNKTNIDWIPEEFASLEKLENLSITNNNLVTLHGELVSLQSLRSLVIRKNRINKDGLPGDLFKLDELSVLDLSHNQLKAIPFDLDKCRGLLVLNLANNFIETIPNSLFVNLTELLYLDLSDNKLETLPPQMRRLVNLQVLILCNNPLGHHPLRLLQALTSLRVLNLSNTQRTLQNIPTSLDNLVHLQELNLSRNNLSRIPDVFLTFKSLKRLNMSDNNIQELPSGIDECWPNLEVINFSRNKLKSLPQSISKLEKLRRIYVNDNDLEFEGIPNSIGKLYNLQVFMAANNRLKLIPEGVVRCGKLNKLVLANNDLITLPDAIYLLNDLKVLDLSNNANLVLPPKPTDLQGNQSIYNIDFTLANQLKKTPTADSGSFITSSTSPKDPIARKLRLVRRAKEKTNESESSKVLKGMTELAKVNENNIKLYDNEENLKPKRWEESLEKPKLDYSEFFDEDVGQYPGLIIWEIDNFVPSRLDEALYGKFYEADCYIILRTYVNENQNLDWEIFYLIGSATSIDKKACSAVHAVNLRNHLSAHCRTIREEQGDESEQFLQLFPQGITYIEGGRTASGFYTVEEVAASTCMYRLHEVSCRQLYMHSVPLSVHSLDSHFVCLVDTGYKLYLWQGKFAKNTVKQKARLLVEKINKEERKDQSEIIFVNQALEPEEFWQLFEDEEDANQNEFHDQSLSEFNPFNPLLYKVCIGTGYLELPQVQYLPKQLTKAHFDTRNVYIMDVNTDVYIWIGQKSPRLLRAAALKLAQEIFVMIKRPKHAVVTRCFQGTETQSFKSRFASWDEIVAVDFTRTAESVQKIGANLNKWVAEHSKLKYDLSALFMPRPKLIAKQEAQQLSDEWNDDLESMDAFVLQNKRFAKLPKEEFGHFFSGECYVFLCRYWVPVEAAASSESAEEDEQLVDQTQSVVYFWQGRDASNMGWLNFTFGLQKTFESRFGEKIDVIRVYQQQENLKFLSHFKQKFVIHKGTRDLSPNCVNRLIQPEVEFYQLRANCDPTTLRCVQIDLHPSMVLYSTYCYLLKLPPEEQQKGQILIWCGAQCEEDYIEIAKEIALSMYPSDLYELTEIQQGQENEQFTKHLSQMTVDEDISFIYYSRLFKCSNDKGYFTISEKCSDFCQDDLLDEDIMILDNGTQVFIWLGVHCSDVEIKLAYKSAQVYVQNMRLKQPDRPRTLMLTMKGKETRKFTKCFHGWCHFKSVKDPRIELDKQMLPIIYSHSNFYLRSKAQN